MALTTSEEALVRQLLDQQAAILSLAGNEATITSKLGATKVTLSDLDAVSVLADADLLLARQGTTDKSVSSSVLRAYISPNASETVRGIVELATSAETIAGTDSERAIHPAGLAAALATGAAPSGSIIYVAKNTAPTGYLKANGAAVSRTTYSALFAAIGTTFGVGDGSTTFNLPDLRGEFIRAWDDGKGTDSGRAFGTSQLDQMQKLTGQLSLVTNAGVACGMGSVSGAFTSGATSTNNLPNSTAGSAKTSRVDFDSAASPNARVSSTDTGETRPRNIALLACIKY